MNGSRMFGRVIRGRDALMMHEDERTATFVTQAALDFCSRRFTVGRTGLTSNESVAAKVAIMSIEC